MLDGRAAGGYTGALAPRRSEAFSRLEGSNPLGVHIPIPLYSHSLGLSGGLEEKDRFQDPSVSYPVKPLTGMHPSGKIRLHPPPRIGVGIGTIYSARAT